MNILIVSVDLLPRIGGISLMAHHLANEMSGHGHRVLVLGPAGTCVPREHPHKYEVLEDVESDVIKRSGRESRQEDLRIRELVASTLKKNAVNRVLVLHHFYYGVGTLRACQDLGVPCSGYFHGLELKSQLTQGYPADHLKLIEERRTGTLRERTFYFAGSCSEILTNSRYTANLLDGFQVKPETSVTGCGIPNLDLVRESKLSPEYHPLQRARRRARFDLGEQPCLGYVGRLVGSKRVDRIVEICERTPTLSALIAGDGPDADGLRRKIVGSRLERRVKLLGRVTEADKWSILRACDFACLLSQPDEIKGDVEGFGIALLEGAAAGAVPVSSGTGGMLDVVHHAETGLILPSNGSDSGSVLQMFAAETSLMQQMVSSARAQLELRFNWTTISREMIARWT